MNRYKQLFSRFLGSKPERLHMAAHSHHPWPDCSEAAHAQAWSDAATHIDGKWGVVFGEVIPEAQRHIARILSLPDPQSICFAPNTHEFVLRLPSCLPAKPRILTTDSEFHSFSRQLSRWREAGQAEVESIPALPFESLEERFCAAAAEGDYDMVFLSQVFFNSGFFVDFTERLADLLEGKKAKLVIDGYHAFMAVPLSLAKLANRAFFIGGGYKYAMAGEGVCFMHCPPGVWERPVNTGWFAGFAELEGSAGSVAYAEGGQRFAGATFDVSGLYRFNAVQRMLSEERLDVRTIHNHVGALQKLFIAEAERCELSLGELLPGKDAPERGHFLTYRSQRAATLQSALAEQNVITDVRGDRLRFGFGIYHDEDDIKSLIEALRALS